VSNENAKNEKPTINREQVVLWAMDAGFNPGFVRMNIASFEKLVSKVQSHINSDIYNQEERVEQWPLKP
jgi:hypothetical protein